MTATATRKPKGLPKPRNPWPASPIQPPKPAAVIRCEHGAHLNEWCWECDDIVRRPVTLMVVPEPASCATHAANRLTRAEDVRDVLVCLGCTARSVDGDDWPALVALAAANLDLSRGRPARPLHPDTVVEVERLMREVR